MLAALVLSAGTRTLLHGLVSASVADDDDDDAANMVRTPSRIRVKNGQTMLVLSAAAQQNGGIETARAGSSTAQAAMDAYGEVIDAAALINLSNGYRNAVVQLAAARARESASRAALARARSLYRDRQNVSAAQLQSARSSFQTDAAARAAAQSNLSALAATIAQSWGTALARAVEQRTGLLDRLIARREFLVIVTLQPGTVPAAAPASATARLASGQPLRLELISAGTSTNPRVQGLRYYYSAAAAPGLVTGLSLPITLEVEARTGAERLVPESAVVWLQGKPWVYRRTAPGTFVRLAIAPERQRSDGAYVVPDLEPDAQIVVRGAQMLLSEEFRAQVERQGDD